MTSVWRSGTLARMAARVAFALILLPILALFGCDDREAEVVEPVAADRAAPPPEDDAGTIRLVFPYGSEKKAWLTAATEEFNRAGNAIADGRTIVVDARPMGSGEQIAEILEGRLEAHLVSPASGLFVELGNAQSRAATGGDLVGQTENLVLSPVVIAMWRPMAEALGWPDQPVGWQDVLDLVDVDAGWASVGHPEWGDFKYGHTHPEYSNSGLISLVAEVYAGAGKTRGLTADDLARPEVAAFLAAIEKGVVHYGSSTGFFGSKMFDRGPQFLSAAVLYENMVIESYGGVTEASYDLPFPVVALYPSEGTFWSDHPVGVVRRDHVTDAHREAAEIYVDYLLDEPRQRQALAYGFRPGDPAIPVTSPVDPAHGADPAEPRNVLEVPPADVVRGVIDLWRANKKHANVALVLDRSGSMQDGGKIGSAKDGAAALIGMMSDYDTLAVTTFSDAATIVLPPAPLSESRDAAERAVGGMFAEGGTALYDAIAQAHRRVGERAGDDTINAVVVLSDGEDRDSRKSLDDLLAQIRSGGERETVRVFTIGYGGGAETAVLERIAEASDGKAYEGDAGDIREVFKDIATFF